jgi:hypothetical protein
MKPSNLINYSNILTCAKAAPPVLLLLLLLLLLLHYRLELGHIPLVIMLDIVNPWNNTWKKNN